MLIKHQSMINASKHTHTQKKKQLAFDKSLQISHIFFKDLSIIFHRINTSMQHICMPKFIEIFIIYYRCKSINIIVAIHTLEVIWN